MVHYKTDLNKFITDYKNDISIDFYSEGTAFGIEKVVYKDIKDISLEYDI